MRTHTLFPEPISLNGYQTILGSCSDVEMLRLSHGNLVRQYSVVNVATVGPGLTFQLTHNSADNYLGSVGRNWRHTGVSYLTFSGSPVNQVTFHDGQGRQYDYDWDSVASAWKRQNDTVFLPATLSQVGLQWELAFYPDGDTLTFNSSGKLVQVEDVHGLSLTYAYTGAQLTSVTEPMGRSMTFAYTGNLLTSVTDPNGNQTLLNYDSNSNLTSIVGPEGCQVTYAYVDGTSGRISSRTDARNNTYLYTYHTSGRLWTVTDPEANVLTYTYGNVNELISLAYAGHYQSFSRTLLTDARGKVWDYRFDKFGNLWRIIDPLNHIKRMYWSDDQKLLYIAEGYRTENAQNGTYGPKDSIHNRYTRTVYDAAGNQLAEVDANGLVTQMEYDTESRLIGIAPGRATLAVAGEWFEHFGKEGFVVCSALDTLSDLVQLPSYVDGTQGILPGETDSTNAFVRALPDKPKHRFDVRAPWMKMPGSPPRETYQRTLGMWRSDGSNNSFTFRVPMAETRDFNLSLYTHCADQPYHADDGAQWELVYAGAFGRDIEVLVTDNDPETGLRRRQSFRYPNTAPGVWMTFAVHGVQNEEIRVKVRSRVINTDQFPMISCIAFDAPENRRTVMQYTGSDLTYIRNPLGEVTELEYNTDGTLDKVIDAKLRETLFLYEDTHKNLTKIMDAALGETVMTYDLNGNVTSMQDADSRTVTMQYDGKNRLITVTDPLNHATQFDFDPAGNLLWVKDAKLRTTSFVYNSQNRLSKVVDAKGQQTQFQYDATGNLSQITDPLSRVSQFVYDDAGRMVQSLLPDAQSVKYALNSINRLVAITSPNGVQSDWENIGVEGAANVLDNPHMEQTWNFAPSAPRRWVRSDDHPSTNFYQANRSSAEAHSGTYSLPADSTQKWWQNDVAVYAGGRYVGRAFAKKAAGGASDFLASIAGIVRNFDAEGVTQAEPTQKTPVATSWTELKPMVIDIPGDTQATRRQPPLARFELRAEKTNSSDSTSNVYFDAATLQMLSTCFEYDGHNLREIATPDGARVRREFDRLGRLTRIVDPIGRTVELRYDALDRVLSIEDSLGNSLAYEYDATGQMVTFTDAMARTTAFAYDALDRLETITYPDLTTEEFSYSAAGDLLSYTDNLGQERTFQYDNAHRLTHVFYPPSGLQSLVLAYDEVGNLVQRTERNGDIEKFFYDQLYRVTRTQFLPAAGAGWDLRSKYDAVGNRLQLAEPSANPALYGTALYGGTSVYPLVSPFWSVPSGGYDEMNRLVEFKDSAGDSTELSYDVEGRRTQISAPNGTLTAATYDIVGKLLQLRTEDDTATELLKLRYGYNLAGDRLALQTDKASYLYHLDHAGRLIQETVNRWNQRYYEQFAQGELSACVLDRATNRVKMASISDNLQVLDCDRWQVDMQEYSYSWAGHRPRDPLRAGLQLHVKEGAHFVYPSGWTATNYFDDSQIRDPLGFGTSYMSESLLHRVKLKGDFDIVAEWDGFSLTEPANHTAAAALYPLSVQLIMGVAKLDGTLPASIARRFVAVPNAEPARHFYDTTVDGTRVMVVTTAADQTGKFRIKRQGSTLTLYRWDAGTSAWVVGNTSYTTYTSDDVRLSLTGWAYEGGFNFRFKDLYHFSSGAKNYLTTTDAGFYTSSIYDAGQAVQWSRISWAETLATNTDVQFQIAVSNSINGPFTFVGPDETSATFYTTPAGEALDNTSTFLGRYCRYKVKLTTTDGLDTPSFGNVHLTFGATGMLASECRVFDYDPAGNITKITTITDAGSAVDDRNPVANPINNLNQVLQRDVGGASWLYSYDDNGNMTGKTDGTDTWIYSFSDENRLTRVQGPGGVDVAYRYDSLGRMLERDDGTDVTTFSWDGFDCCREVTGSSETIYHIPDGMLHSFRRDGDVFTVHSDALGSVRMVTDDTGAVVARFELDAYGEVISELDTVPGGMPYRFVGALGCRADEATGLTYMRQRWYDPQLAGFVSPDPIGLQGGANLYAYCANAPVNYIDPTGTAIWLLLANFLVDYSGYILAAEAAMVAGAGMRAMQGRQDIASPGDMLIDAAGGMALNKLLNGFLAWRHQRNYGSYLDEIAVWRGENSRCVGEGRTVAVIFVNTQRLEINGKHFSVSGMQSPVGLRAPKNIQLTPIRTDSANKALYDAERKGLEMVVSKGAGLKGSVTVVADRNVCPQCAGSAAEVAAMNPGLNVSIAGPNPQAASSWLSRLAAQVGSSTARGAR